MRSRLALGVLGIGSLLVTSCSRVEQYPPVTQAAFERLSTPPTMLAPPPPPEPGVHSADPLHTPWPVRKLREVETRAAAGDKNAAWDLALYYGLTLHDERREDEWQHRAAVLGHPEAERWTAYMIRRDATAFAPHGDTPQRAVEKLLVDACVEQRHGTSCYDLAEAYEAGYFGETDPAAARAHYERGAELGDRMCWTTLARRLHEGVGGPAEEARAYYWISLEARCVDPRSVSGKETWQLRETLAESLGLDTLEQQWRAVDSFMADYRAGKRQIYSDPFLGSAIRDDLRREGERLAQRREKAHRASLRRTLGGQ